MSPKRHKGDTKTFEELTFQEQAKAMNMTALQFRKQLKAHLKKSPADGPSLQRILHTRLQLLERILRGFATP